MKQTLKKSVSILLSLIMVFSLFTIVPLSASADSYVYLTDFLPVSSSGTATGYSTYDNHFYKIEWSGINTSETSSVQLYIATYDNLYSQRLRCHRNNGRVMLVLYASASNSMWEPSHITNLTPGQSSDGYTNEAMLGKNANTDYYPPVYQKVCTVTCMAANTPTWNWSDDFTACTATFTCSANSSLTATVNADVTTSGYTATASVTFNGTSYTDTKSLVTNYNITYVLNGGTNASGNPSTYANNVGVSSFAAPTREHYTFGGWYDNENCTGTPVTSIPAGSSGDRTLYAKWTIDSYTVTWKNSDGSTLKTEQVNYGVTPSYGGTPTKASDGKYYYTFSGWSPAVTAVSDNVTYTAQFTKTPITTHFSQSGDTYTIHDATGWNVFCDWLQDNDAYNRFTGKTVLLADDITVTRMAGGSGHDFKGTFDGQGHTLTVAYGTADSPVSDDDKAAPFRNVESGCVIKNLHTQGTIYTSRKYAGGIVGTQYGTVKLENCRSSVTINSMTAGDGSHGGLVGHIGNSSSAKLTIDGCVFDGKLLSVGDDPTTNCAGFVGYKDNNATFTITNSLYAPKALEADETEPAGTGATFVRNGSVGANCYYTRTLGTAQGKQAYTISAGKSVTLAPSGTAKTYTVSGITAYENNSCLMHGDTIYAGNGDSVSLTLGKTTLVGYRFTGYTVTAGTLQGTKNPYTLTMPDSNVTVNALYEEAPSSFDASTGTLTLSGNVLNGGVSKGIVLPDGVNKLAVRHINVDSSGATLPENSARLFQYVTNVTSIDLTGADTSGVKSMNNMFYSCTKLTELDLSSFDTSSATNMKEMFYNCFSLEALDLSSFDTSSVKNMNNMFYRCSSLKALDLSSFDTSNVTNMSSMFYGCDNLTTIYVSDKWNTGSVTNSGNMFSNCTNLKGGNGTAYDGTKTDKTYAVIDKNGQPGYLTGVYTLTLPDHMEIATNAGANMKVGNKYLSGAVVTVRYAGEVEEGYPLIVSANGMALPEENGVYTITITDSNVTVTAETAFTDGIGAALAGHSISLEGDIGVNFYMQLADVIADSETAYMYFTIPDTSPEYQEQTVYIKDVEPVEGGYYVFKCRVAAKDMNSVITAQILGVDKETTVYTYSVKDYADWLIEHKNDSEAYTKAAPLVEKMLRYGAYAKEYFDKTNTLPDLGDVNIDSKFDTYTSTVSDDLFDGATLSLKSQTTLSLYFTDTDKLTFTCVDENGAERTVETVRNGSTQIARIRNIAASELQNSFTVTVKKGETVLGAITYSPMNYCYKALNGSTENENLINAVKALAAYSDAANEFFKAGA